MVIVAKTIGCTLPIGAKVLKLDPADHGVTDDHDDVDAGWSPDGVIFNLVCHLLDMTV